MEVKQAQKITNKILNKWEGTRMVEKHFGESDELLKELKGIIINQLVQLDEIIIHTPQHTLAATPHTSAILNAVSADPEKATTASANNAVSINSPDVPNNSTPNDNYRIELEE